MRSTTKHALSPTERSQCVLYQLPTLCASPKPGWHRGEAGIVGRRSSEEVAGRFLRTVWWSSGKTDWQGRRLLELPVNEWNLPNTCETLWPSFSRAQLPSLVLRYSLALNHLPEQVLLCYTMIWWLRVNWNAFPQEQGHLFIAKSSRCHLVREK